MSSSRTGYKHRLRILLAIALSSLCAVQLATSIKQLPAQAQEATLTTDEDIANYANAVAAIEPLRLAAYEGASDVLAAANSEVSLVDNRLSCLSSDIEDMPEVAEADRVALQGILVDYCNAAIGLADDNGLTPQRFNSITAKHQQDKELAQKIRAAIADSNTVSIKAVE
ncbi:MAG: DUF4168 domain-containing protein [Phormidesmis sp.]